MNTRRPGEIRTTNTDGEGDPPIAPEAKQEQLTDPSGQPVTDPVGDPILT